MVMQVALRHRTSYRYDRLVASARRSCGCARRRTAAPRSCSYSLKVEPEQALHQLAAGPVRQLPGPAGLPGADRAASRSRSTSWPRWRRSTRSTSSSSPRAENYPFAYEPELQQGPGALSGVRAARARCSPRSLRRRSARSRTAIVDFLVDLNQRPAAATSATSIRMEPGIQTCEETLALRSGSCRDFGLAAGADPAPPRPRRPLRLRLPDPAQAGREGARRPVRRRAGLHRPARLGRGLPARRRLDRPRPDLGPAGRRGPHPAGLHARPADAPPRSPAPSTRARSSSASR